MKLIVRVLVIFAISYLLNACGGDDRIADPMVTGANLFYGAKAKFSVGVTAIRSDLSLRVMGCPNLVRTADRSKTEETFECDVRTSGEIRFEGVDNTGTVVFSKSFLVPDPQVEISTSVGSFRVDLFPSRVPVTVDNFLAYVDEKFYEGLLVHRVIPNFAVQMGGFEPTMKLKEPTKNPIPLESNMGLSNLRGTLGMARLKDPSYNSATSQFFVNLVDNKDLDYKSPTDPGYAIFGKVSSGMDLIDLIALRPTTTLMPHENVPVVDITILKTTRIR